MEHTACGKQRLGLVRVIGGCPKEDEKIGRKIMVTVGQAKNEEGLGYKSLCKVDGREERLLVANV